MAKPDNCEISNEKQICSKKQHAESFVSNENNNTLGSNNPAAESGPFPAILEVLTRNKPILDILSVTCLVLIMASIGVVVCVVVLFGKSSPNTNTGANPVRILTRAEWLAQPPRERPYLLELPVHNVIIADTASEECLTQTLCVAMVGIIQQFHMAPDSKNFSDIAFNFLVGADGNVYEGCGWDRQGAYTKGFNNDSICIAFIGRFTDVEAPETQLSAARQLLAMGVERGMIDPHYRLYGHRQLAPVEGPGEKLFEKIKTWQHWSNELGPSHRGNEKY